MTDEEFDNYCSKLKRKFEVNLINHEVVKEDIIFNLPKSKTKIW